MTEEWRDIPVHYIIKVCKHQRNSTKGLQWAYAEEVIT